MEEELREFLEELASREKSPATIAKYAHDVRLFLLGGGSHMRRSPNSR